MLILLTARRLKPETFDEWRRAWEPDEWPKEFTRAHVLRNRDDPNEVISFGMWEGSAEELAAFGERTESRSRIERMQPFIAEKLIDGVYDVEVIEPGA